MFFGIFVFNRVSILSTFVLNRVSFLRQEPITLFLDDKQPALMFYECLKLGIKNRNSVLNRVGKSAIFVLNRVRVWGAEPHLPTQGYIEYPPPPELMHVSWGDKTAASCKRRLLNNMTSERELGGNHNTIFKRPFSDHVYHQELVLIGTTNTCTPHV